MALLPRFQHLRLVVFGIFISAICPPDFASRPIPFRYAEPRAVSIVQVHASRHGNTVLLVVDEILRGPTKASSITVAADIWDTRRPKDLGSGEPSYIVLLGDNDELMCGHLSGLPLLSGGCNGILPVVQGAVPANHAWLYDGESEKAIQVEDIVRELRRRPEVSCASASKGVRLPVGLAIPPLIPDQPWIESAENWNGGIAVWTVEEVNRVFYVSHDLIEAVPLGCSAGSVEDLAEAPFGSFAACRDQTLHLFHVSGDDWEERALPKKFGRFRWSRMVASGRLLLLFVDRKAYYSVDGTEWVRVRSISGARRFWKILYAAEYSEASDQALYFGWNSGEWGGALWKVPYSLDGDRLSLSRPMMLIDEPVVGIAVGADGGVWYATGLAHLGGRWAGLYLDSGDEIQKLIEQSSLHEPAGKYSLSQRADISGLAVRDDLPYFVATDFGIYRLTEAGPEKTLEGKFYVQYKSDACCITGSAPQGLVVMPDGAFVVPMRSTGLLVLRQIDDVTTICQIPLPKADASCD